MLEDSSNMAFRSFGIRGNYKQETREGYNLLDTTEFEDNTSDGVSLVVNEDGTLELNGTATADTTFRILKTEKSITATGNENIVINKLNGTLEGTVRLICQDNDYGNTVYSQIGTSEFTNKLTADITYNIFSLQVYNGAVCNNLKLGLVISSSKTAYEQYGATPSVKIPSEIETTGENGAVNETVCNKNMFDWESAGMVNKGIDSTTGILMQTTNLTRLANENLIFLKAGAYTISYKLADKLWLWVYNRDKEYQYQYLMQNWVDNITTYTFTVNEDVYLRIILAKTNDGEMPLTDNYEIQLKGEDTATDYVAHESQTVTMPVQQPMVSEEDYFDWENEKEVHGWNKKVFDGTERWRMPKTNEENAVFENLESTVIYDFADDTEKQLSTHFEWKGRKNGYSVALNAGVGMYTLSTNSGYKYVYFVVPLTVASTVEEWKAYLAEQAEAGTPLTNYYIATTPTELDFTTEQKAVKEQIKNLHSYKNVTHIFSTDQVPAIADVTYFKDLETVINNNKQETEARLEAIETLLSTTGTSALLLDNYETDLLEEVEQNA